MRAERRLGELCALLPKAKGSRGQLVGTTDGSGGTALVSPEVGLVRRDAEHGGGFVIASNSRTYRRIVFSPNGILRPASLALPTPSWGVAC
jgi:hypothetical protein